MMFVATSYFYGQVSPNQVDTNTVYEQSEMGTYILKDIVIDGVKKYSPDQVLRFTGLSKGEKVEIPGQKISNAIKKLWETENFSQVQVYVQNLEGESVVLRFNLQDLKELGAVSVQMKGRNKVSKSKTEKIVKDNKLLPGTKITNDLVATIKNRIPQEYVKKGFADAKISLQKL